MALGRMGINSADPALATDSLRLRLPCDANGPWPSERLGRAAGAVDHPFDPWLGEFEVPSIKAPAGHAMRVLLALDADRGEISKPCQRVR